MRDSVDVLVSGQRIVPQAAIIPMLITIIAVIVILQLLGTSAPPGRKSTRLLFRYPRPTEERAARSAAIDCMEN